MIDLFGLLKEGYAENTIKKYNDNLFLVNDVIINKENVIFENVLHPKVNEKHNTLTFISNEKCYVMSIIDNSVIVQDCDYIFVNRFLYFITKDNIDVVYNILNNTFFHGNRYEYMPLKDGVIYNKKTNTIIDVNNKCIFDIDDVEISSEYEESRDKNYYISVLEKTKLIEIVYSYNTGETDENYFVYITFSGEIIYKGEERLILTSY